MALTPTIVIVDVDSGVAPSEMSAVAAALTRQVMEHFAGAWGQMALVRAATSARPAARGEWRLELRRVPTIEGALGFHDRQPDGTPILYVFPELCEQDGKKWSSCASHEVLEALADPGLHRCAQAPDGRVWAAEVCDQVESDSYLIDGVEVSNFNLPANYEPMGFPGEKYDYLGLQTQPLEVRPGGYAQFFDPAQGWMTLGEMRAYRLVLAALGLSRGARRAFVSG